MPFVLPTFHITVSIYDHQEEDDPLGAARLTSEANLAWGRRVNTASTGGTGDPEGFGSCMTLLLPPRTDVRGPQCRNDGSTWGDIVEAPTGTGRLYAVIAVDDIGRGFDNEHRAAVLWATSKWGVWPSPIT